jgi:hypothetical protein
MPGAAEVPFLATRLVEFSSRPSPQAVVWLELVPTARPRGADEALGDAGLHTNTGYARRELCPKGISDRSIARARAERKPGQLTPN